MKIERRVKKVHIAENDNIGKRDAVVGLLLGNVYVTKKIYWGIPIVSLLVSMFFFLSPSPAQLIIAKLVAFLLGMYGLVIIGLRIKNFF